jgi:hypothetical protein
VKAEIDRPARRRRPPSVRRRVVAAAAGLVLLALAVPNVGPALRAARAEGTPGTFTAERLRCVEHPGHEACTWYGTFVPDGDHGSAGAAAESTSLYGGRHGLDRGDTTAAVDTGRSGRVYPPGGSREWIAIALTLAAGLGLVLLPSIPSLVARGRRKEGAR